MQQNIAKLLTHPSDNFGNKQNKREKLGKNLCKKNYQKPNKNHENYIDT